MRFTLNGVPVSVDVEGEGARRLLDVLRETVEMTGTKEGCGEGECGACSVLIDGAVVNSCLVAAGQVEGCDVVTVEGLAEEDGQLSALQQAFIDRGAAQCGICTPGMLLAAHVLLRQRRPNDSRVRLSSTDVEDAVALANALQLAQRPEVDQCARPHDAGVQHHHQVGAAGDGARALGLDTEARRLDEIARLEVGHFRHASTASMILV